MTLRVTPWGKDNFKATSGEAEAKDCRPNAQY